MIIRIGTDEEKEWILTKYPYRQPDCPEMHGCGKRKWELSSQSIL